MAKGKPNRMYRKLAGQNYTRQSYIKKQRQVKVIQFQSGELVQENFKNFFEILSIAPTQIRQRAMESVRICLMKRLNKFVGKKNYFYKLKIFRHHFLRENKFATGAGADRTSQGMRQAFGKAIDKAARVNSNQVLLEIYYSNIEGVNKKVKEVLRKITPKIGAQTLIREVLAK